jgi:hypothetical protein
MLMQHEGDKNLTLGQTMHSAINTATLKGFQNTVVRFYTWC